MLKVPSDKDTFTLLYLLALIIMVVITATIVLPRNSVLAEEGKGVTVEGIEKRGVDLWTKRGCRSKYHFNDLLQLHIKSERDGYLTVFDLMADGEVQILYPNKYHQDNFIKGGKKYSIPARNDNFRLRIGPPKGADRLLAVVTEDDRRLIEEQYSQFAQAFPKLNSSREKVVRQVSKGVSVIPKEKWWAADSCTICVEESCKLEENEWWVLVIGIADYMNKPFKYGGRTYRFNDLNYTVNDAKAMEEVIGVDPKRVKTILNSEASYETIKNAIHEWLGQADKEDSALLYFSGHGANQPDTNGDEPDKWDEVLVPYDYPRAEKFITDDEINKWLKGLRAEEVVFIADSCHSGSSHKAVRTFYRPEGAKLVNPLQDSIGQDLANPKDVNSKGAGGKEGTIIALEASKPNQNAQENSRFKHGVFTNFLIEGWEGAADENGDSKISLKELFKYTRKKVYNFTNQRQEPICDGCKEGGSIYLAELR